MNSQQYKAAGLPPPPDRAESAASGDEAAASRLRSESPTSPPPADADTDDELEMVAHSDQGTPEPTSPSSTPELNVTGSPAVSGAESPPANKTAPADVPAALTLPRFPYPPISLAHHFPFGPSVLGFGAGSPAASLGLHAPLPFHPQLGLLSHHLLFPGGHPAAATPFPPPPPPPPPSGAPHEPRS